MAKVKISNLPAIPSSNLSDIFPAVQGGVTYKESLTQVLSLFQGKITSLGVLTSPIDMGSHLISNLTNPISMQDAATKSYVDTLLSPTFNRVNMQIFTSDGTYTPTTGMKYIIVEVQGAGGAGGGSPFTAAFQYSSGSGGASGGYSKSLLDATTIGVSQAITVGAAGIGSPADNGGNGGNSSFGSLVTAFGGSGGIVGVSGLINIITGGDGPVAGTGNVANGGESGNISITLSATESMSGTGASCIYGSGGEGRHSVSDGAGVGNSGVGYGAGGGGSLSFNIGSTFSGGSGSPGIIIITEFISS